MRRIFNRAGGSLGTTGSVGWMFERKGVIMVNRQTGVDEDDLLEIALEAGAEDMNAEDDQFEITTAAEGFRGVLEILQAKEIAFVSAEITMLPRTPSSWTRMAPRRY